MKATRNKTGLERLVAPLGDCLTPESARRIVRLKANPVLQKRMDYLADRCNEGQLTSEEHLEYSNYVSYGTFIAILKSKARKLLSDNNSKS